jgi:uncharacterized membrane protein YjgN (DUF898 family)
MNQSILLASPVPLLAAASGASARVKHRFDFRGSGAEYFRIWIVNLLLTIVTLGVFSAWAKIRRLRYFYGNTVLDDHAFDYHARPAAILKGRLIVFGAYVLFLVGMQVYQPLLFALIPLAIVGVPWILLCSRRFQLRMTSWRNLRFDFGGGYAGALSAYTGWHLIAAGLFAAVWMTRPTPFLIGLTFLAVSLLYPFWVHQRVRYSIDHASYGRERFSFSASAGQFYGFWFATAAMSIAAYLLFSYLFLSHSALRDAMHLDEPLGGVDLVMRSGPVGWLILMLAAVTGFAIAAFYRAKLLNTSFGGARVGLGYLRSELEVSRLAWINVTNLLGIVATLGVFYPWAKVRLVRYQVENMYLDSDGRFADFLASSQPETSALGEEAGDFFDVDLGV